MCCQFTIKIIKTKPVPAQDSILFISFPHRLVLIGWAGGILWCKVEIQGISVISNWGYSLVLLFFCICSETAVLKCHVRS